MPREFRREVCIKFPLNADDTIAAVGTVSILQYDPWGGLAAQEWPVTYKDFVANGGGFMPLADLATAGLVRSESRPAGGKKARGRKGAGN